MREQIPFFLPRKKWSGNELIGACALTRKSHDIFHVPPCVFMITRRVVGEEVSLSMPASVNDDKCEGDSK